MTLKEQWKAEIAKFNKSLSVKQLAKIIVPKQKEWKRMYYKIYRDIENGRLDYTQLGGARSPILIAIEDAKAYVDSFKSSNNDETPPSRLLPFPDKKK